MWGRGATWEGKSRVGWEAGFFDVMAPLPPCWHFDRLCQSVKHFFKKAQNRLLCGTLTPFLTVAPPAGVRFRNSIWISVYLALIFLSLKLNGWVLGWVKMSPHPNNCVWNSGCRGRQNGCRKIPWTFPVGASHTNSPFSTLPIWGQCVLKRVVFVSASPGLPGES